MRSMKGRPGAIYNPWGHKFRQLKLALRVLSGQTISSQTAILTLSQLILNCCIFSCWKLSTIIPMSGIFRKHYNSYIYHYANARILKRLPGTCTIFGNREFNPNRLECSLKILLAVENGQQEIILSKGGFLKFV